MLLLLNFDLEYTIRKVQENQEELQLNGTHKLLAYANDVNLLCKDINTIKNKEDPLDTDKGNGIVVNVEKT